MARDVMAVRLHLPQIRVLEVVEDAPGALVVRSTIQEGPDGSRCYGVRLHLPQIRGSRTHRARWW